MKRVFLSYSSKNASEVERFDRELRRRGVPLWRDRDNLAAGRLTHKVIEKASKEAAGFVFYLTRQAAESRWVRETERAYALENQRQWSGFGIVPVFRDGIAEVTEHMKRLGEDAASDPAAYDLSAFTGHVVDPARVKSGRLGEEHRTAARKVLASLLSTIADGAGRGSRLNVGLMTREGPALGKYPIDCLLDWTADYASPPTPGVCRENLLPALQAFRSEVQGYLPRLPLHVVPQCHLTMALAFGFEFRRNTGIALEVREPHSGAIWLGPAAPLEPLADAWSFTKLPVGESGDVGLAVNITREAKQFQGEIKDYLRGAGPPVSRVLYFEPKVGPSIRALSDLKPEVAHRMAVAVVERLIKDPKVHESNAVHLFYAGPPGLAILIAQQLSNTRPVQTYEWSSGERTYAPSFELVSS